MIKFEIKIYIQGSQNTFIAMLCKIKKHNSLEEEGSCKNVFLPYKQWQDGYFCCLLRFPEKKEKNSF